MGCGFGLKERECGCRKYLNIFLQKYLNVFLQNYFRSLFAMKEFISQMNYFLCSGLRGRFAEKATSKYKERYITIFTKQRLYFIKDKFHLLSRGDFTWSRFWCIEYFLGLIWVFLLSFRGQFYHFPCVCVCQQTVHSHSSWRSKWQ